jgi:uncharacterized protein (TIGR02246 family)
VTARNPEDCDRLFAERLNAGDVDGVLALYEEGASYVHRDGVATGRAAIRARIERLAAMRPTLRCDVRRAVRAGEDLAVLYNDWTLTASGGDGKPVEITGRALEIVRRRSDGEWLFVVDDPHGRD